MDDKHYRARLPSARTLRRTLWMIRIDPAGRSSALLLANTRRSGLNATRGDWNVPTRLFHLPTKRNWSSFLNLCRRAPDIAPAV